MKSIKQDSNNPNLFNIEPEDVWEKVSKAEGDGPPSSDEWIRVLNSSYANYNSHLGLVCRSKEGTLNIGAGLYICEYDSNNHKFFLRKISVVPETYINLDNFDEELKNDINIFLASKELHKDLGIPYRRGALLHGSPGTGKTSFIKQQIAAFSDQAFIVFFSEFPGTTQIEALCRVPLPKIFIFEEVTQILRDGEDSKFLNLLDGVEALDSTYVIATTNYPEDLPGNIVDRPSRFELLIEFNELNAKQAATLAEGFLKRPLTKKEAELMDGFSSAYIKEICLYSLSRSIVVIDAVKRYSERKKVVKNKFAKPKTRIGFVNE